MAALRQRHSGFGRDAERSAVLPDAAGRIFIGEFLETQEQTEGQSPRLAAALAFCLKRLATLVIAKLDRLARLVPIISNVMESGVGFVAVDLPRQTGGRFTSLPVVEHERYMISRQTHAALAAATKRGTRLGNPIPDMAKIGAAVSASDALFRANIFSAIRGPCVEERSLREVAADLNATGIESARGGFRYTQTVRSSLRP